MLRMQRGPLHSAVSRCNITDVLALDYQALRQRVDDRFAGNLAAVVRAWPRGQVAPNRSTILRWLRGETFPRCRSDLLAFAGALDCDPFGLWQINTATFAALRLRVIAAVAADSWTRLMPALTFVEDFVRYAEPWPPAGIARRYFGRDWTSADHSLPPSEGRDGFLTFRLHPESRREACTGRVWHFAWRPAPDAAWQPYGFVHLRPGQLQLFAFNGKLDHRASDGDAAQSFGVETWIGQGAAQFRIASLHRFSMDVLEPGRSAGPCVRFA